jgi:hypothetical protein
MSAETAATHPTVAAIIQDLELIDGEVLLPNARLVHWAEVLRRDHAGPEHALVYQQLGGLALQLAERRALAALQLEALATLPSAGAAHAARANGMRFERKAAPSTLLGGPVRRAAAPLAAGPTTSARSFIPPPRFLR